MGVFRKGQKSDRKKAPREKFVIPEQEEDSYFWLRALDGNYILDVQTGKISTVDARECIAMSAEDDEGNRLFADAADVAKNLAISAPAMLAILKKIGDLSGTPISGTVIPNG